MTPTKEQQLIIETAKTGANLAINAFAGAAKCLGKGTLITMADSTLKPVEEIVKGDKVLGVDGSARTVLEVSSGHEEMFKIKQVKGIDFICNKSHILSVKMAIGKNARYKYKDTFLYKGDVVNLSVEDYLKQSPSFQKDAKCYTPTLMEFNSNISVFEPYFVGLWLGDGSTSSCCISKPDIEIKEYLESFAKEHKLSFTTYSYEGKCPTYALGKDTSKGTENLGNSLLKSLGIFNNKHIPFNYKFASVKDRLELIAGLLDSDGSLVKNYFTWSSKSLTLTKDMEFVCRTLGFKVTRETFKVKGYPNDYYRLSIFGEGIEKIPTKIQRKKAAPRQQIKNANVTGFTVEPLGLGEYYGFTIDGDSLFLLEDFTVTHNTTTCVLIAKELTKPSLYIAFNKSIADEAREKFPSNVECRTMHSLAYEAIIKPSFKLKKKLGGFIDRNDIFEILPEVERLHINHRPKVLANIIDLVNKFCQSDKYEFGEFLASLEDESLQQYEKYLTKVWLELTNQNTKYQITHDVYLKMFHLQKPNFRFYKTIYLDECLTEKQLVKTNIGCISIKSLYNKFNRGDKLPLILSYNLEKKIYEYKEMTGALISENRETLLVKTEGLNKIECTPNHPILTARGYVEAGKLLVGKDIILLDSKDNQKSKLMLNEDQLQIVLGSYLGDGSLAKQSDLETYRIRFVQGEKQYKYLKSKADTFKIEKIDKIKSGYTGKANVFTAQSKVFALPDSPWNLLKKMEARALAIWYMDDGSLSNCNNCSLHSNKFTLEETEHLVSILNTNFGLYPVICETKGYFYLHFNKENGEKLLKLIAPYMHEDLFYKNPFSLGNYTWDDNYMPYGGNIVSEVIPIGLNTVYDITVKDNHNFITTRVRNMSTVGCIVHNCQDSNPVVLDMVLNASKHCQIIAVGDKYQSIYEWRGAVNAFDRLKDFTQLNLTNSFRFGPNIAELANVVLENLGSDSSVVGNGNESNINSYAVLTRTNAGLFSYLIDAAWKGKKLKVIGDLTDLFSAMYTANNIKFNGDRSKRFHKFIASFETWKDLVDAAEHNMEVAKILNLIDNYPQVHDSITMAKKAIFNEKEDSCYDYIICTGHKSKGLEFDEVTLADDFVPKNLETVDFDFETWLNEDQNGNLLYVVLTRAKVKVNLPGDLKFLLSRK